MSMFAKYLIGLALALPMGAYVAGSLVSSASGEPERRDPVIIQDAEPVAPSPSQPARPPAPADGAGGDDDDDDTDDDVDDNGIRVVTPDPARVDDRDDDDDQDDGIGGDDDADDGDDDTTDD